MTPADGWPRWAVAAAGCLVLLAGAACYANSLDGELVFDDIDAIAGNQSLRSLRSAAVLTPPAHTTATGRPLLNVTLAVNYALGGLNVRGYHLANVLLHLCAALLLFALVRGTLLLQAVPHVFRASATGIALAVALVWVVHPLQTEVVSYIVQRAEALAALFLFLTLYCLLRGARAEGRGYGWYAGAAIACFLGTMSKEVAVVVPVVALLYDRAFLAGSWREALRRRWPLYVVLFATWIPLGLLVYSAGGRDGTAGLMTAVSPWCYAAAQSLWVLHYLRLSIWPSPLVFDYGQAVEPWRPATGLSTALMLGLLALSAALFVARPALGFLPLAFFVVLAPSSSFVPIATQVAAERRMYPALAALVPLAVLAVVRLGSLLPGPALLRRGVLAALLVACLVPLAVQTHWRNQVYCSELALWADTVAKVPDNARAHTNLGRALLARDRPAQAIDHLRQAVALAPEEPRPHAVLGFALFTTGKVAEAAACYREVV